jgi:hypothetical protein
MRARKHHRPVGQGQLCPGLAVQQGNCLHAAIIATQAAQRKAEVASSQEFKNLKAENGNRNWEPPLPSFSFQLLAFSFTFPELAPGSWLLGTGYWLPTPG